MWCACVKMVVVRYTVCNANGKRTVYLLVIVKDPKSESDESELEESINDTRICKR